VPAGAEMLVGAYTPTSTMLAHSVSRAVPRRARRAKAASPVGDVDPGAAWPTLAEEAGVG
jgi:hypothetical protein